MYLQQQYLKNLLVVIHQEEEVVQAVLLPFAMMAHIAMLLIIKEHVLGMGA